MGFIIAIIIVIYTLLVTWVWHSLGEIEKIKKIGIIAIGILITYLITLMIFNLSKNGVVYQNEEMIGKIKNMIVLVFTGVNGIIILPFLSRILNKINEGEIEKEECSKLLRTIGIIFIICLFFEYGYMKDMQQGILNIFNIMNK